MNSVWGFGKRNGCSNSSPDIQEDIIDHDEGSDRDTKAFGENHCHDFNSVHCTAETDRKTTADTGYHAAKQCTEQQIRAGKR